MIPGIKPTPTIIDAFLDKAPWLSSKCPVGCDAVMPSSPGIVETIAVLVGDGCIGVVGKCSVKEPFSSSRPTGTT